MPEDSAAKAAARSVRIDKYEVVAHIATGGMGAVYKARNTETGGEVALKVLMPDMAARPAMLERFRREARSAAKLAHENIVSVFEFGEAHGTHFLAMEFVDGIDLHEYVRKKPRGHLSRNEALFVILQACRALDHAHSHNIIHRDVKPSNFLVNVWNGRPLVKLTDLGLAREMEAEDFRITRAGTTVGTVDFMAPEQARDSSNADGRSDLYSLGCTWYFLLTGQPPFTKGGLGERLLKIMTEEAPDVRTLNSRVSAATAAVLRRLLAKAPEDRYPTAADLLRDLEALGRGELDADANALDEDLDAVRTAPEVRPAEKSDATGPSPLTPRHLSAVRSSPSTDIHESAPPDRLPPERRPRRRRAPESNSRLFLSAAGAALVLVASLIAFFQSRRHTPADEPVVETSAAQRTNIPGPGRHDGATESEVTHELTTSNPEIVRPTWRRLYIPSIPIDPAAMRKQMLAPWERPVSAASEPVVLVVRRGSGSNVFTSLSAACAAAPPGRPVVLEIHDNGPLFDLPSTLADRALTVRAGRGYRPLLVWDIPRTLEERHRAGIADTEPLHFLDVRNGTLTLENVDLVVYWPGAAATGPIALLGVRDGELTATSCTFSAAGRAADVTVARFLSTRSQNGRCRFARCFARGSLTGLELDAPGAEVLLEGCLLVGSERPLVKVLAADERPATLRAISSTFVSGQTFLEIRPATSTDRNPAFRWLGWDLLVSRSGVEGARSDLLRMQGDVSPLHVNWQAVNCLYAGWQNLLGGTSTLPASIPPRASRRQWGRIEGDDVATDPWPPARSEPAERHPSEYAVSPDSPVAVAASAAPDRPVGCDTEILPEGRDNWMSLCGNSQSLKLATRPQEVPNIPVPTNDARYHGGRLDLATISDLGAYLRRMEETIGLGPRVVLQLSGAGEYATTPIRLTGKSLVISVLPNANKADLPLTLRPAARAEAEAFIDVEDGNLEIRGGVLRLPEQEGGRPLPWLIKVRGGDLRLDGCRLIGPQHTVPSSYQGLVAFEGVAGGERELVRLCQVNRAVLASGRDGLHVAGPSVRLGLHQSIVVAAAAGINLLPGVGRPSIQCLLERSTIAVGEAVVRLNEGNVHALAVEPALLQSHACAFLAPFAARSEPHKAGMLRYEGEALSRGLLVWHSEGDLYDRRLHCDAAAAGSELPEKLHPIAAWAHLWGSANVRQPAPEDRLLRILDAYPWPLERLTLPRDRAAFGANLAALGISKKPG
jgi:serine/threonine-protein kinase